MEISLGISLVSLFVAVATLVFTHLRPPRIACFFGPWITVGYPPAGGFSLSVPATFSNHGAQTGGIIRAALSVYRPDAPHQRYFMQWDSFLKLDFEAGRWIHDEIAHALIIPGKSIVAKNILFVWDATSAPGLTVREGAYKLVFHLWTSQSAQPSSETHEVIISETAVQSLADSGDPSKPRAIHLQLDQQLERNKLMNEFEYRSLLKQSIKQPA